MGKHIRGGFRKLGEMSSIEPRGGIIMGRNLRTNYVKCDRCGESVYKADLSRHVCKEVRDE